MSAQDDQLSVDTIDAPRPDRRGAFRILFFCLLALGAGNTMLIGAVLPPLTRQLGLPDWTAGAIFSLSALFWAVSSPFWGRMSSRFGRRPIIATGLVAFMASMLFLAICVQLGVAGVVTNWFVLFLLLLAARGFYGLVGPGVRAGAQAYVADRTSADERTEELASLGAGFTLGTALGPAAAAAMIASLGLVSPLLATAGIALIMALVVLKYLPENKPPQNRNARIVRNKGIWKTPQVLPFLIYGFAVAVVIGLLMQTFPFVLMDRLDVEGREASQLMAAASTLGAMSMLIAQLVVIPRFKMPPSWLMGVGAAALVLYSAALLVAADFGTFCLIQLMFGLGMGLAMPGYISGASLANPKELQGDVAGLVTSVVGYGYMISPLLGLWAYEHIHPQAPFLFGILIMSGVAAFVLLRLRATQPPTPTD